MIRSSSPFVFDSRINMRLNGCRQRPPLIFYDTRNKAEFLCAHSIVQVILAPFGFVTSPWVVLGGKCVDCRSTYSYVTVAATYWPVIVICCLWCVVGIMNTWLLYERTWTLGDTSLFYLRVQCCICWTRQPCPLQRKGHGRDSMLYSVSLLVLSWVWGTPVWTWHPVLLSVPRANAPLRRVQSFHQPSPRVHLRHPLDGIKSTAVVRVLPFLWHATLLVKEPRLVMISPSSTLYISLVHSLQYISILILSFSRYPFPSVFQSNL